jgi:signal peptidase I
VKEWIKDIATAMLVAFVIVQFVKPTIVKQSSMEPNFHDKDYLIATRVFNINNLKKDDVVTFRYSDGRLFIKRVIGLPGDKIKIAGGEVYVNGKKDDQSYTNGGETWVIGPGDDEVLELTVPEGQVFCLGDNRGDSHDSRDDDVGCVTSDNLKWKVRFRLLPLKSMGTIKIK